MLLLVAAFVSANNYAGRYDGMLNIGGEESTNSVLVFPGSDENHINFILPDFSYGELNLGDIVLINIPVSNTGGMSLTDYPFYIPLLDEHVRINVVDFEDEEAGETLYSTFSEGQVQIVLIIETTTLPEPLPVLFVGEQQSASGFQARNAGFETWEDVSYRGLMSTVNGREPLNWSSFITGSGDLIGSAANNKQLKESTMKRPGSTGSKSAVLTSNMLLGVKANGNMTTGQINAGSMTATDASGNYSFTNTADGSFNLPFVGHPDSMVLWARFVPADKNASNAANVAHMNAVLHGNGNYHDPESGNVNNGITKFAVAGENILPVATNATNLNGFAWQRVAKAFEYEDVEDEDTKYMLITLTTCATPGGGSTYSTGTFSKKYFYDSLYVDDLEMIYNSKLGDLAIDGIPVAFDQNGQATLDKVWSDVDYTIVASAANRYATEYHGYDPINHTLVVMVAGENFVQDPKSCHTYTVQMANPNHSRDVTVDNYGTICLPAEVAAEDREGATFYNIAGVLKNSNGEYMSIVLEEVEEGTALVAGKPYIFKASADQINLKMNGALTSTVQEANGLVGNLGADAQVPNGKYIISGNKFYLVDSNVSFKQYRAYIDASQIQEAAETAGRRVILGIDGVEEVTAIEDTEAAEIVKFIENGQILIKKNGRIYNIMGQIVR